MLCHPHVKLRAVELIACSASVETKRKWLQNFRRPFQYATFDFVDLMRIDWRAAFYCPKAAEHITADGICIGHKLAQSFIVRPWEAAADAQLSPGTMLRSRLMVQEPRCRKLLRQFTSPAAGGLSEAELEELVDTMMAEGDDEPEACVAAFLTDTVASTDGKLLSAPGCRPLLRSMGTTAPAIQLLPLVLWPVALELTRQRRLSFQSEAKLQRDSPLLYNFLQPHLSSESVPADVISLIDMLRKVGAH